MTLSPQAILAILLLLLIATLSGSTYYYHNEYGKEKTKNSVLQNSNDDLTKTIEADKVAVNKLAKDSKDREDAARVALIKVQKEFDEYVRKSQEYLLAQPTDINICTSANTLFNQYINQK